MCNTKCVMKEQQYQKIIELRWAGGGFIAHNNNATELTESLKRGDVIAFTEVTARDLKYHRCYMSLLKFIYSYLPQSFKKQVSAGDFYKFLKHLQGKYKVIFSFKDGTKLVEYESISFSTMSQKRFEEYIKEQLPFIYTEVVGSFFDGEIYDGIVSEIEDEYRKFLDKLN